MKSSKIRKIIPVLVIAIVLVLALSSCGGNRALVGTWEVVETNEILSRVGDRMVLNANGTIGAERNSNFRWDVDGEYLVMSLSGFGSTHERFEISGNRLTIQHDARGNRVSVFERVR